RIGLAVVAAVAILLMPSGASAATEFSDVPPSHPFITEIEWLIDNGITQGYSDGTFRPSDPVTRQAMAAFLYRLAGSPVYEPPTVASFTDVQAPGDGDPGHTFFAEIEWLASTGVTTGWDDGTFRPNNSVSRQAMAAFMYRLAGSPSFAV